MKKPKLPKTDSIQKLAEFWNGHDLTDFDEELEEVAEPVFVRATAIKVHLPSQQAKAIQQLAKEKGVSQSELIRAWVIQRLARSSNGRRSRLRKTS